MPGNNLRKLKKAQSAPPKYLISGSKCPGYFTGEEKTFPGWLITIDSGPATQYINYIDSFSMLGRRFLMSVIRGICSFICLVSLCLVAGLGCGDDNGGTGPATPDGPSSPFPARGATNVPVVSPFAWTYADSLADGLLYDVYLGTTYPLPRYRARLRDRSVVIGPLEMNKEYRWKVVAYDPAGDTISSQTWNFTTASSFEFPIAVGNRWDYRFQDIVTYSGAPKAEADDIITGASIVDIASIDTLSDTVAAVHFHTIWTRDGDEGEADNYRLIRDDGMYMYAYDNPWTGPPKVTVPNGVYYEYKGMRFNSISELARTFRTEYPRPPKSLMPDTVFEDPPIKELAYPLEIGQRWVYRDVDLGDVFDIQKEITGFETVTVPCGSFQCYVVRWFWDIDHDGEWDTDIEGYDYISGAGTVKRVYKYLGIYITDYHGNVLYIADVTQTYDLMGLDLHAAPTD